MQAPRIAASLVLLAVGLAAPPAGAQPVDPQRVAAAQVLFEQGQAAMDRKDYATACPKLEEVTRILPNGVGGLLILARCYEGSGRLASAWSAYLVAQSAAAQALRPELERQARARVGALKGKLAHLTIRVPEAVRGVPGLAIQRDGTPVGAAQWGTPMPVDRGKHVIVATAPGKQRWQQDLEVAADGAVVGVDVVALTDAPVAPVAPVAADAPRGASPEPPSFWTTRRIAGATVAGGGLVGVVIGAVFGGIAISKKDQSNDGHCQANACDPTGAQLRSDGLSAASVSTGTFVAGAVLLAAGVTLVLVPSGKPVEARVGVGPGALHLSASF